MTLDVSTLAQTWPRPSRLRPITLIGAGAIVVDAHLPAYRNAGFPVAGLFDRDRERAQAVAQRFGIPTVHADLASALASDPSSIFDIALPPGAVLDTVAALPRGATALIQKPLGRDLGEAARIVAALEARGVTAAVNLQLRFSPMMLAVRDAIARGLIGDIVDIEVRLNCRTPWQLWPFMSALDAVELPMHSIHYLDLIRSLLGEPRGAFARSVPHPHHPALKDARSSIILDYGDRARVCLSLNHTYRWGPRHEGAAIRIEGMKGCAIAGLGLLLNYPRGEAETLEIVTEGSDWVSVPVVRPWFPDAFVAIMSNVQRFAAGEDAVLHTAARDALKTMALVETCIRSSREGGRPIDGA
jgi:predicted dehydrogenase